MPDHQILLVYRGSMTDIAQQEAEMTRAELEKATQTADVIVKAEML